MASSDSNPSVVDEASVLTGSLSALERDDGWAKNLVDGSRELVVLSRAGKIVYMNRAGQQLLNCNDCIGRPFSDFAHPDYREVLDQLIEEPEGEGGWFPAKMTGEAGSIDVDLACTALQVDGAPTTLIQGRDMTERVRAAATLRDREVRLRGIMNTVVEAIITMDQDGVIVSANKAAEAMFALRQRDLVGAPITRLLPACGADLEAKGGFGGDFIARYLTSGWAHSGEGRRREDQGLRSDGTVFPMEIAVAELRDGSQRLFTGLFRDTTEENRIRESLRQARDELEHRVEERTLELTQEVAERRRAEDELRLAGLVIDHLNEGVAITDSNCLVRSINAAWTRISGYTVTDLEGKRPPSEEFIKADPSLYERMWSDIRRTGRWDGEYWTERKDGTRYAERLSVAAITDADGNVTQHALVISDVTKRKEDEERIRFQANYDSLTKLPNRSLFLDRLGQNLAHMGRQGRNLALMFIDLDGFKLVNDTLGHDMGDELLKEASERLLSCIRNGDTVARLGGDEFTVIMPNLEDPRNAPIVAQRVLDSLSQAFVLGGHEVFVSGSIGITIFPDDANDASELIKNADAAMYRAKEQGKANYQFFTSDMNAEVKERLVLKNNLSKALARDEFELYYQPKLDLMTGRIRSAEALMRWQNPELGNVSPARFIPILEETGGVVEVGAWAIETACRRHKAWLDEGLPPVRIAVNLSARQLRDLSFVDRVREVLEETGTPPSGLEIEITESMLMSDAERAVRTLGKLSDMGIKIAMDDFGTGYSSLSYLKKFPIDTIKIDRSFVSDIATDPDDAEIIRTIITMGRTLNRSIVAEGVETQDQLDLLRAYDCDEIQGYFFSRPLPWDKATDFLKSQMI